MCDTVDRLLASLLDLFKCLYCVWFMVSVAWWRLQGSDARWLGVLRVGTKKSCFCRGKLCGPLHLLMDHG